MKTHHGRIVKKRRDLRFDIGDRVHSKAIGCKAEFDGIVEKVCGGYYHVRDDEGLWHRSAGEISRLEA